MAKRNGKALLVIEIFFTLHRYCTVTVQYWCSVFNYGGLIFTLSLAFVHLMEWLKCMFHFPNYYCSRNLYFCQKCVVNLTEYLSHDSKFCPSASISAQLGNVDCFPALLLVERYLEGQNLCCAVEQQCTGIPNGLNFFLNTAVHHIAC